MSRCLSLLAMACLALGEGAGKDVAEAPAGSFTMSALDQGTGQFETDGVTRRPGTLVRFAHPLLVARTEVTQGDFQALLHRNPSRFRDAPDAPLRPVEQVSLFDAVEYCNAQIGRAHV